MNRREDLLYKYAGIIKNCHGKENNIELLPLHSKTMNDECQILLYNESNNIIEM